MGTPMVNEWTPVQTGGQQAALARNLLAASAVWCVAQAGTGGTDQRAMFVALLGTGAVVAGDQFEGQSEAADPIQVQIETIRRSLRLSVAQLAKLFGVTRPTIYSWQKGGAISEDNARRIREVAAAIEPNLAFLEVQTGRLGSRAIYGSKSLVDLIAHGNAPEEATESLLRILRDEDSQRDRLARRLEMRRTSRGTPDTETFG